MEHGIKPRTAARLRWVFMVIVFIAPFIGIWIRQIRVEQIKVEGARMRGQLAQIHLALNNFETVNGHPLPRLMQSKDGTTVSWRERLIPYLYDIYDKKEHPELLTENAPIWYRSRSDSSDPTFTSIVAVYDPDNNGDNSQRNFAVVAMAETGIRWRSPQDFTLADFAKLLSQRDSSSQNPITVISASGKSLSFVDGGLVTYNLEHQEELSELLFR